MEESRFLNRINTGEYQRYSLPLKEFMCSDKETRLLAFSTFQVFCFLKKVLAQSAFSSIFLKWKYDLFLMTDCNSLIFDLGTTLKAFCFEQSILLRFSESFANPLLLYLLLIGYF